METSIEKIKQALLYILKRFSKSDKPTEEELIAFGGEQERQRAGRLTLLCPNCHRHTMALQQLNVYTFEYVCLECKAHEPPQIPPDVLARHTRAMLKKTHLRHDPKAPPTAQIPRVPMKEILPEKPGRTCDPFLVAGPPDGDVTTKREAVRPVEKAG